MQSYNNSFIKHILNKYHMQKLKILNRKEIKKIQEKLKEQFNCSLENDYAYLINQKNKVFIINKDISKINLDNLKIDKMGLYFAEYSKNHVRLSKEGAQLLIRNHPEASNLVTIDKSELKEYFKGQELKKDLGKDNRPVILKYNKEIIGYAQYKDKIILNYLPKIHRGEVIA
jgi:NOL1/NOP2/fmu family ribosome biogenesis protein